VRVLLANERVNVNCKDVIFESTLIMYHEIGNCMPLHHAIHNGDVAMAELLLSAPRIDVNCRDSEGRTPLHIAAAKNGVEMVRILRATGQADITIRAHDGVFCETFRTAPECTRNPEVIAAINGGANAWGCAVA
jgi:ankyrin repeat protein